MPAFFEVRPFSPIDLPLVRRLTPQGVSLDSATNLTRGVNIIEGAVWGAVPLADLGTPTFVIRQSEHNYVAQFRHKTGEQHAHIVFIAPDLTRCESEHAWLNLLDAMTAAAGRRGATTLNAEVAETSEEFLTLQQAGFAIYARQEIWKRHPAPVPAKGNPVLRPSSDTDAIGIHSLYASIIPRMVLHADELPDPRHGGLVYEHNGKIAAFFAAQEGKYGIYVRAFIHPDECNGQVDKILHNALAFLPRAEKLPVYFSVRRYQSWLGGALEALGFEPSASQAVMVKHTVCRIEHPVLRSIHSLESAMHALPPVMGNGVRRIDYLSVDEGVVDGISNN
jgi:hypothetical protein